MNRRSLAGHQGDSKVTSLVQENLAALPLVQSYTQEEREQRRFNEQAENAFLKRLLQHRIEVIYWLAIAILFGIATAGLSWFGAGEILAARLTVGELLIFLSYLTQLYEPLNQLTHVGATVSDASAGMQRIFEILDTRVELDHHQGQTVKDSVPQLKRVEIKFENVTFGYNPSTPVLRGISLHIEAGETVAVVGPSGAGKTTLLNLLPRFFDPEKGEIFLNAKNIRELPLFDLRRQIAYVFQEPLLIPATIRKTSVMAGKRDPREKSWPPALRRMQRSLFSDCQMGTTRLSGRGGATERRGKTRAQYCARLSQGCSSPAPG